MYGENMYGEPNGFTTKTEYPDRDMGQVGNSLASASAQPETGAYTWSGYVNAAQMQPGVTVPVRRRSERLEKMMDRFGCYGFGCVCYGILFTVCLYPGFCGISVPLLSVVTMAALLLVAARTETENGKGTVFYFAALTALSVSNCLTGSRLLITFNTMGMLLLVLSFLVCRFCGTEGLGFAGYLLQICRAPFAAVGYWGCFFSSLKRYMAGKEKARSGRSRAVWVGIALSIPVLIIVLSLLASADAVFGHLLGRMLGAVRFPAHFFYMCLLLTVGSIGVYGLLAYFMNRGGQEKSAAGERRRWEPLTGITFLSILTAVYLVFSSIQIFYLFMENAALPEGQTYSSYAREGFFQLLFVCLINLAIVLVCISWFREHAALKALLTVFSVCTIIMDASSAMRMVLYVQACQLTFLRLLVLWALAVIDVVLAGCILTIYRVRFPLFRYMMTTVTVCYVIFSLARPDDIIARYNLSHDDGSLDVRYLCGLSSDAVPAIKEAGMLDILYEYPRKLDKKTARYENMAIRNFNFSDYTAGKILAEYEQDSGLPEKAASEREAFAGITKM